MSAKAAGAGGGLVESLTNVAATLVALLHTRIELLSTEVEEAVAHLSSLLVLAVAALFCLGVAVLLGAALLVTAFWDTHRLLALGALSLLFLAASLTSWLCAAHRARTCPRLFAASLAELIKDRQRLGSRP